MPKKNLTSQGIKGLPIPDGGRVDYQDEGVPGLVLRVTSTGARSYSVSYWKGGKRPRVTLGSADLLSLGEARKQAKDILRSVKLGLDPAGERREERQAITFEDLAHEYVERWAKPRKAAKGAREDERRIENLLVQRWGSRRAKDIRKRDVVELLDEFTDAGKPYARNRLQALISKVYSFGISRDAVEVNPARGIDREPEKPRERVLTDAELETVIPLFRAEGLAGLGFRFLLLTAQRPKEVFGMRWSEIEGETWSLPAERSKNKRPNLVPLSAQAREVLNELRAYDNGSSYIFPSPRRQKPFLGYAKAAQRVKEKAKLSEQWNIYDLKSTILTGLERLRIAAPVISAVANHAPAGVTARHYAHYGYQDEKRDALQKWGDYVDKLDPSTTGQVVEIRRKA